MIEVTSKIRIYETDGNDAYNDDRYLIIRSHWNDPNMIVISSKEEGKTTTITVLGRDLKAAIDNAQNNVRH